MMDGDDPDDVITSFLGPARKRGYRYIYFEHPTFSGEGVQRVVISLFPGDDLKIINRYTNKEAERIKQAPPNDDLQAEIEDTQDESAALFRQARKKE